MTAPNPTIASLFATPPKQWCNRGDPHLWNAMRAHFADQALPDTSERLTAILAAAFAALTGHAIDEPQPFFVKAFAHGGLTSGYIAAPFWRTTVVPLLVAHYTAARAHPHSRS